MQVYMDEQFYHSLQFKYEYEKNKKSKNSYAAIMKSQEPNYYYASCDVLIENLRDPENEH
jgi:stalled ribosome alternative rescue factor ArfA